MAMPAKPRSRAKSDTHPLLATTVISVALLVPLAIAAGAKWLDLSPERARDGKPVPRWIDPGEVRATTRDGTIVKLRVELDAPDRSGVESRLSDVGLLLEVSIGALERSQLVGADGIAALANDMRVRINAFLEASGVAPLRSVVIQDLWYTQR
jgi:hypothetical protein